MSEFTAYVPASCGEWLQGWLDDEAVLVSCPIDIGARARVTSGGNGAGVSVMPPDREKAARAVQSLLARAAEGPPVSSRSWSVSIDDPLPKGRGYATSTADVSAAAAALAAALEKPLSSEEIAALACEIEPSDSVMFSGLCLLAYRTGAWSRPLGEAPRLSLLILDAGEGMDTVRYNRTLDLTRVRTLEGETRQALEALQDGMRGRDVRLLGEAARISAAAYQKIVDSALVTKALDWAPQLNAAGPLRAHSGSLVGLIFLDDDEARSAARRLEGVFHGDVRLVHTTGGGVILYGE